MTENEKEVLKLQKIDCLVKALGTMVMIPNYEVDPNNIAKKQFAGSIQQPILVDAYRTLAMDKLSQVINSL